ncbi:MAG: metallophosphoesterase family protein [Candidatus Rokuibacteriota bacterium]
MAGARSVLLAADDPVVIGAGDIATCTRDDDELTAQILDQHPDAPVFTLGDNVYEDGTPAEFMDCYDPTWGRHKARTIPVVGNHEYHMPGAVGYYGYFGLASTPPDGYYSTDVGDWHIVVLNSNCSEVGGCHEGSPQELWLRSDLAANHKKCTLALMHHPRFSSGQAGNTLSLAKLWKTLIFYHADVVVSSHDHDYERFAPQTQSGRLNLNKGLRSFVVGTGGAEQRNFKRVRANSEVRHTGTPGVLKLTLHATSYDWEFVPAAGFTFTDTGTADCRL